MSALVNETLRVTETNAAGDESEGTIWGIRYELFWPAAGGLVASAMVFALLHQRGAGLTASLLVAITPALTIVSWVILKQTHPPAHDVDLVLLWLKGPGFGPKISDPNLL